MRQVHVLVTDDDPIIRELLREVCEMSGFAVETASDGDQALTHLLRADGPWIVLLDIMMPRMSGLEVCSRLLAEGGPAAQHLVVLMTAGLFPDDNPPPPARLVLRKPFDLTTLQDLLARLAETVQLDDDSSSVCTPSAASGQRSSTHLAA